MTIPAYFNIGVACTDAHLDTPAAERVAMVVEDEALGVNQLTYRELAGLTSRFAQALRELGVDAGERVLIRLPNYIAYPVVFLGSIKRGAIPVPSSILLTAEEVRWLLDDSGAAVLVTDLASWAAMGDPLCHPCGLRHVILVSRDTGADALRMTSAIHLARAGLLTEPVRAPGIHVHDIAALLAAIDYCDSPHPTRADDPAYLVYTSGTSGYPKGVLHAQRALLGRRPAIQHWFDFCCDDRVLHSGKFNWTYVLGTAMMDPLYMGQTAVVYEGPPDATQWIPRIAWHGATIFIGVPTIYRQILQKTNFTADDAPTLRHCMCAGEHLSDEVLAGWRERFGQEIYEAIGMSECSYYISQRRGVPIRPGSVGIPQPGHIVKLLDDDLHEVAAGEEGQIAIGEDDPGLFLCYWNQPEETAKLRRGGWFLTGDYARRDADGYFWFMGRKDDIIKSFGYRVSPFEVERVLKDHPAVADCAVVGEAVGPDKAIVVAYVLPTACQPADAEAIMAYAAQHLASYKCPRAIHFVAVLPRTANGKVLRRALRSAH
ncbi:MAG TPA: AMP-binding protein [Anaerolineae bacterium]|nr:AMP-binding protein [Anaerolineae bacterium]